MFKITVEVWPFGRKPHPDWDGPPQIELACYNDGTGTPERGNYCVMEMDSGEEPMFTYARYVREQMAPDIIVQGYPRGSNEDQSHLAGLAGLILDLYSIGGKYANAWEKDDAATV